MEALLPGDPSAIGPYQLLGRLGAGGMGQVFLGRAQGGRMVAVKVVHQELAREPDFRRRFRAEVAAARRVGGLWTAPVLDSDTESAVPWVATGYVAGVPLRQLVDAWHGPLAEHAVWALALGLAQALTEIHGNGLIHRDLKPSNVMVTLEGPKVIDFGIARAVDASSVTRTGAMVGSPGYMPPEQIRGEELTGAADVFALGAVLAYAATGFDPFSWDGAHLHTVLYRVMYEAPQLGPERGRLTGELRAFVTRCLAKEAGARPALAEILPLAEDRAGTEFWLPAALAARLGRHAADLLALDGPGAVDVAAAAWGPGPADRPAPLGRPRGNTPPRYGDQTTYASDPSLPATPPAPAAPPRRGGRSVLWAAALGALALAVAVPLIALNTGGGGGERRPDAAGESAGRGGDADQAGAPLSHLVPEDVRQAGGLTVHVASESEPVLFVEDGEPVGFEIDLARAVGERLGVEVAFSLAGESEAAAGAAVREGEDAAAHIAMAGYPDTPEEREAMGVDLVNHYSDGWAVLSGDPERAGLFAELCGMTLATYEGEFMEGMVREHTADCPEPVEVLPLPTRDAMGEAIAAGEADAAVVLYSQIAYWAGRHPESGLSVGYPDEQRGLRGIAVPRGQDELREAVAAAVGELVRDGTYAELLDRWHISEAAIDWPTVNAGS
ncbi:serine/threonine-protein kinase [Streptomyces marincola]|uniref:Protein kinase domain-containing protein n=1 Tax=Streptomyces marincola TaxID=2878388 RepID=A0A1W7D4K4_9ACTN|nr:serine/threonine-protein kinase [Streptomyces marincola]ARQ72001.1 hypothetical protein CAG99_27040 [Streptomyces marincola]